MKRSGSQFAAAVKVLAERDFRSQELHPSREQLRQFVKGYFSEGSEESERIEDHLALCRDCSDFVLGTRLESQPRGIVSFLASPKLAYAVAAVLAAALFLMFWVPQAPQPHGNIHLASFTPFEDRGDGSRRGVPSDSDFERLEIPVEAEAVLMILGFAGTADFSQYSAEVLEVSDPRKQLSIWSTMDLQRMPEGHFSIEIPSSKLQPGRYSIRVHGFQDQGSSKLAEYLVQVPE